LSDIKAVRYEDYVEYIEEGQVLPVSELKSMDVEGIDVAVLTPMPRNRPNKTSADGRAGIPEVVQGHDSRRSIIGYADWRDGRGRALQGTQSDSVISKCQHTSSRSLPSPRSFFPSANLQITCSGVCLRRFIVVQSSAPNHGDRTRTTGGSDQGDPVRGRRAGG